MKNTLCIVILLLTIITSHVDGDLVTTNLNALIYDSELIVVATAVQVARSERTPAFSEDGGGYTILTVNKVHRGQYEGETIKVVWSAEVHEQDLTEIGQEYLLFLTQWKSNEFLGTHYGRSFWPIEYKTMEASQAAYIGYRYPITEVNIQNSWLFDQNYHISSRQSDTGRTIKDKEHILYERLIAELDSLVADRALEIKEYERKKEEYNRIVREKPPAIYPDCPDYMIKQTENVGRRVKTTCRGILDPDFPIQNGWIAFGIKGTHYIHYKEGKEHGPIKVMDQKESGRGWEGNYKMGFLYGKRIHWYAKGIKKQEANFLDGEFEGQFSEWYENGQLECTAFYKMGVRLNEQCWDEQGVPTN
ncbi:MAG: hypothetical protein K8I00_09135 [Candidatus Omnitrophica bacterium]|nr:hypothetical protein [Candidatus Omnitrophota bacterium]